MLLVIEGEGGSVLVNIAAHYPLIDERVLEIGGDAEAFFSAADPSDWYLHLGRPPLDDRISVKALSLFEVLGYLTIERTGLMTGFQIGFGESWKFGKLELGFDVHISGDGSLSFDPVSVYGRAELSGSIHASAFGIGLTLAAARERRSTRVLATVRLRPRRHRRRPAHPAADALAGREAALAQHREARLRRPVHVFAAGAPDHRGGAGSRQRARPPRRRYRWTPARW